MEFLLLLVSISATYEISVNAVQAALKRKLFWNEKVNLTFFTTRAPGTRLLVARCTPGRPHHGTTFIPVIPWLYIGSAAP